MTGAQRDVGTGAGAGSRPRVVVVGSGFAGYHACRSLARRMGDAVDIVLVSPTNYFLYLPLLPEVAGGVLEPRRISVSLTTTLPPNVRHAHGEVDELDLARRTARWMDPEGRHHTSSYDRLVLAVGSVHKLMPVPGLSEFAHGFRGIPEALYLRDHLIRQIELAAGTDDPDERRARCTFVVVGAGYTGTEVVAQGQLLTRELARSARLGEDAVRWLLVSRSEVLHGLDEHLGQTADRVLRERGVEVRTGDTVDEVTADGVRLHSGEQVPTRTLVWCVGVRPDPLIESVGLELAEGRLVVDRTLTVPGHPEVFACGDAAAVPDPAKPGRYTAMTAQHAERQGRLAGRNVAASLGRGRTRRYRHRDLGFLVDLGGTDAAANPLHLHLSGLPAKTITRGYHLLSMPGNRLRTATDWLLVAVLTRQTTQLGLVRSASVPLDTSSPEVPHHPRMAFPPERSPGDPEGAG
ncbi:NAD(P)/FAD-dependent oxidoreductase [Actinomycetospora sp. TBRC 11914]|uniref:NAD(P)/FAD-dependent oxidoreductase n=1 Tax=Actinomycetospora sp. TBRC 11914 TaxID=2729387 RepID=UPI00145D8113|nr:NAD(P)/FAD-dependent oxidoreductase [Actinomycetospora sp. TBRC 11914]NMO89347.1 NAD(P)/FAD-dependent oxidoreductase [Actinomycetospora sp. TBRC 11914]